VSNRREKEDCFCEDKIYVEYLKSVRLTLCASTSVAGRRLAEQENPSACATVDGKVSEREIKLYGLCVSVIKSECVTT
jgi:hypothetical protein